MQLERDQVDPFAQILVVAYLGAAAGARSFTEEWGIPPTRTHKSHWMRSIAQAQVTQSERFMLHPDFAELGRVQVTDITANDSYLVRSKAAIEIEAAMGQPEQLAFPFELRTRNSTAVPNMVAYGFEREGMHLWSSASKQAATGKRLIPAGSLEYVGFWPFEGVPSPDNGGGLTFDQGAPDPFNDLGDDVDFGEAEGL
ncbi:hypothetical protein [[Mycobacterium] burgundiense]|uniref:Uncharacterized protein n=1 Tax=[Mycobacterium] burgundiense TaxID=3064286 RepID=A0ABM9LE17_9MYCO|nr:hypothetical protein [Mycolicibacterium sp. MU0053]CAJ1497445.1 hypothetical protein MU0053_000910 [Mycolicibacterium sp. MU0053]